MVHCFQFGSIIIKINWKSKQTSFILFIIYSQHLRLWVDHHHRLLFIKKNIFMINKKKWFGNNKNALYIQRFLLSTIHVYWLLPPNPPSMSEFIIILYYFTQTEQKRREKVYFFPFFFLLFFFFFFCKKWNYPLWYYFYLFIKYKHLYLLLDTMEVKAYFRYKKEWMNNIK